MQNQSQSGCFFCCLPLAIGLSLGAATVASLVLLQLVR